MDLNGFNERYFWDGVDASIIETNGINQYELIKDKYFEYDQIFIKIFTILKKKSIKLNI